MNGITKSLLTGLIEVVSKQNLVDTVKGKNIVNKATGEAVITAALLAQLPVPEVTADNLITVIVYVVGSVYAIYKFLRKA